MMESKKVLAGESSNEVDVDEPEEAGEYSEDKFMSMAVVIPVRKRGRPTKSTPATKNKKPKISDDEYKEEIIPAKERGSKAKPLPPAPILTSARAMMESKKVLAGESSNEVDVDEPEEAGEYSEDKFMSMAVVIPVRKRGRPTKSTPATKNKKPKISDDEYKEEIIPAKERGSKAKPLPPAPILTSARAMMESKKVLAGESSNEVDVDEPEEAGEYSEDKFMSMAVVIPVGKRGRPTKSTPATKNKKPKISDDEYKEEIIPAKERGSKAKPLPPAPILTSARAMMESKKVLAGESSNEVDVDEPEEAGEYSEDKFMSMAVVIPVGKRGRPTKSTPATKNKKPKISDDEYKEEIIPAKERGSKAKPLPPAPILTSARAMMESKKVLAGESSNEVDVDEPEEAGEYSEDKFMSMAVVIPVGKRGRPAKSTPTTKNKKPKNSDDEYKEEIIPAKERGSKAKPLPPAPILTSARAMMESKKVLAGESSNEVDVDEPEEAGEYSEDKFMSMAVVIPVGKRGRPAKSTPATKNKKPKNSDDEYKEEIIPAKERGSKAKPLPPAPILTSARAMMESKKVLAGESSNEVDVDEPEEAGEYSEDKFMSMAVVIPVGKRGRPTKDSGRGRPTKVLKVEESEDDDDVDVSEEELNQGPNAKPVPKFTSGTFVVSKIEMCRKYNPAVWKIHKLKILEKFIPFLQDDKVFYKRIERYRPWFSNFNECYIAPVSFIKHTKEEQIIEFHKDKIKKDPKLRSWLGKNYNRKKLN